MSISRAAPFAINRSRMGFDMAAEEVVLSPVASPHSHGYCIRQGRRCSAQSPRGYLCSTIEVQVLSHGLESRLAIKDARERLGSQSPLQQRRAKARSPAENFARSS